MKYRPIISICAIMMIAPIAAHAETAADLLAGTNWAKANPLYPLEGLTPQQIETMALCTSDTVQFSNDGGKIIVLQNIRSVGVDKTTYSFGHAVEKDGKTEIALFYGASGTPSKIYEMSADRIRLIEKGGLFGDIGHVRCAADLAKPPQPPSR